jgi:hypothetical protein|tara:strand:+ start:2407 stop:3624 length:1218 start_codon:yes stop_codon:yes gene_type:complete
MANKSVSFYGAGPQAAARQQIDPRRLMAQQLMQSGGSTAPVQSIGEGITRALSGVAGGYFAGEANRDQKAEQQAAMADMAKVLSAGNAQQWVDPDTGAVAPNQNPTGGYAGMNAALSDINNPNLAGFAQNVAMGQMQDRRETEKDAAARATKIADRDEGRVYDAGLADAEQERKIALKQAPSGPKEPKTTKDADGFVRYLDGPKAGDRVFPGVEKTPDAQDPKTPLTGFDEETKLRKEFTTAAKDFVKVRDAWSRIQASAKNPSAAGDLALVFNYMKVLDPGSTVREGEFATAAKSAGVPDRIRAEYNKIRSGQRLAPPQRADFVDRGYKLYQAQQTQYQGLEDRYRGLSKQYNLDPERVVYGMGDNAPEYKPAPTASQNAEAKAWADKNPTDPRAVKILKRLAK